MEKLMTPGRGIKENRLSAERKGGLYMEKDELESKRVDSEIGKGRLAGFFGVLFLIFFTAAAPSCSRHLTVNVLYDQAGGLKAGDSAYLNMEKIGTVGPLEVDSKGRILVPLKIDPDFREHITDYSRFIIQEDPFRSDRQSIRVIQLGPGGKPLGDGAVVEGSSSFSAFLERGGREMLGWVRPFLDALGRLEREIECLSDREWQKELEAQIDDWTRELERSSEEVRRYFERDVLPRLEESIRDLRRRLERKGLEKTLQPLEEKIDRLRRVSA
jgi:hypothetical protein